MKMDNNELQTVYIEKLNKDILPKLDFKKLHESYNSSDKQYAKEVLKSLHDAFIQVYQTDYLTDREFEFVLVPAVIKAQKTGDVSIGIVTLDIGSSSEHWGTIFFTDKGLIDDQNESFTKAEREYIDTNFIPYDYWYTIDIERDHHVDFENVPEEICEMLNYCRPSENDLQMNGPEI
ncbi:MULTISPECIES: hypothetical protein [Dehalobacter]|nr:MULTISPECIES: hypothetical protein [unclassified Dehalobacter]MDJ0305660.1 hypothetical protein [Dehalobacter sp.]